MRLAVLRTLLLLACSSLLQGAHCQKRVLALVDNSVKASHSAFFDALGALGFRVDLQTAGEKGLKLREYDHWLYDHLVVFAPKATAFGGEITNTAILEFVDAGKNLILAAAPDASETIRSLASECGVEFDDRGTSVFDHFNYQAAGGATDPKAVLAQDIVDAPAIISKAVEAPVIFQGVAATVPASSELVTVALSAPATAYSHDPKKAMPEPPALPVGAGVALVSLVQARNNARMLVSGSLDMFSNAAFDAEVVVAFTGQRYDQSGNRDFCLDTALWTLQDKGVLVADNMRHSILDSGSSKGRAAQQPHRYRMNDEVELLLDITEIDGGVRRPYKVDDVQVSFVMLDPYVRQAMTHDGSGTYSLQFKVPDVYGVFKYVIEYRHRGYSYIDITHVVPVRPYKHDEFERFLLPAYPYYASVASTMVAFLLVGLAVLYTK